MLGRLLVVLLVLACPVSGLEAQAEDEDVASAWTALLAEAAERLAALAGQAQDRKLFRTRDAIYAEVLRFDANHEKARSWLKYKRRDGAWVRPRYSPPRDRGSRAARDQQEAAAEAWHAWWRGEVVRLFRRAASASATPVADEILRFALAFRSEDPAIRALAGEVRHGEGPDARWVLFETERALAHRQRFLDAAREAARAVAPPRRSRPAPEDRPGVVKWSHVLESDTLRVVGTVSPAELRRHYEIAASAAAVFSTVFGTEVRLPAGDGDAAPFPLYVAATRGHGNAFLAGEPAVSKSAFSRLAGLSLSFLPGRPGAIVKTESQPLRLEATAHAAHAHLTRPVLGHEPGADAAWAIEAVTLYLAWLQVRTRKLCALTDSSANAPPEATGARDPFGSRLRGVDDDAGEVGDATRDWHTQAAEALRDLPLPELRQMSAKRADALDALDLLAGYGIATYVLEAHPSHSVAFFRDVAAQDEADLDAVISKHLGLDLETFLPHLLRWLDEMGALAPPPGEPR